MDVNAHSINDRIGKTSYVGGLIGLKQTIVPCTDFTRPNPVIFIIKLFLINFIN